MKRFLLALVLLLVCSQAVQAQVTSTTRLSGLVTGTAGNITSSSYLLFTDPAFTTDRKISPTVLFDAAGFGPTDVHVSGGNTVNGNLTSTGNGVFTGNVSLTGNLAVTGTSVFTGTVTINGVLDSNLTSGRVPYITTGGIITDTAGFTFNGTTLTMTNAAITGTAAVTGVTTFTGKPVFATGLTNGAGFQHERITTGGIGATSVATVAVTWDTAFADTNYTPVVSVIEASTTSTGLVPLRISAMTVTNCSVIIQNTSAGTLTGTVSVIGIHD